MLTVLLLKGLPIGENKTPDPTVVQIINIAIGALAAAFATVVSFWLGSSQGSRIKAAELQERQAEQNAIVLKRAGEFVTTGEKKPAAKPAKPTNQLDQCLDIVLQQEAAVDRGNTKFGISLDEYNTLGDGTVTDLNDLKRDKAREFYRMRYWNALRCNELPAGVDLVVFDTGADLNSIAEAAKKLQDVVGAKDDGWIGPVTMGAIELKSPRDIVMKLSAARREEKTKLGKAGEVNRVNEVENAAMRMVEAASAVAV